MGKYYTQNDGIFKHHYRVIDDYNMLHVNETSACINHTYNDVERYPDRYKESTEEVFDKALEKTLNHLGINYGKFKFK